MLTTPKLCVSVVAIALLCGVHHIEAQAPAPAPGTVLESDAAAAAAYPISSQEEQPLTNSASLPVTCNITLIGLPASSTPAVSAAGRRLQAATNTSRGLSTADIHCTGSYNVTIVGGPALQPFASLWTGERTDLTARCLCSCPEIDWNSLASSHMQCLRLLCRYGLCPFACREA